MQLKDNINKNITIIGRISDIMWQHMISYQPDYPEIQYFDPKDGDVQLVIYSKSKIENKTNKFIKLFGKVLEIKSSGEPGQKIDDSAYREYHLIVDHYEYVD